MSVHEIEKVNFNLSTLQEDIIRVSDDIMKKTIKYLNNSESFTKIFEFTVNGVDYYFISLFRDGTMEFHFGQYKKKAFATLWSALEKQDIYEVQKLLKEENLLLKDDLANSTLELLEILLSNVMAMIIKGWRKMTLQLLKLWGSQINFTFTENLSQITYIFFQTIIYAVILLMIVI